ncbi:MAG: ABC-type methionine transport system ATPase subunit [Planctomycetota bacterium]|jgi:ABC-type methionine transport system ATPase subunit
MSKQRVFLGFSRAEKDSPILSTLTSRFGLVFSIFGATVNDEKQFVAIELDGDQEKIDEALNFLRGSGVDVDLRE